MIKPTKRLLLLSLFLVLTFSIMSVNALTLTIPANGATISGTAVLNATEMVAVTSCSFYAKSSLTANSSWSSLGTFTNLTAAQTWINGTFKSSVLEDANNYQFNATCTNASITLSSIGTASVTVNNGAPPAPTSLSPSTNTITTSSGVISFSASVTDANTTSCTYTIARGGATSGSDYFTGTGTYSGSNCTFTKSFNDTDSNGDWWWFITASDESQTANSAQNIFQVQLPASGGNLDTAQQNQQQIIAQQQIQEQSPSTYWIIGIIVAFIVLIVIVRRIR